MVYQLLWRLQYILCVSIRLEILVAVESSSFLSKLSRDDRVLWCLR